MPVYLLDDDTNFPDPDLANKDGLLAIGGDLSSERLLNAYKCGIFPWYSDDSPILWWSPDPRAVLFPENFKISKSLKQVINSGKFTISYDKDFENVMKHCAYIPREGQQGTWITDEMIEAYSRLHEKGFAHSIETYASGQLVGGLYGIAIGKVFFGESMFHTLSDASKVALYYLIKHLKSEGFKIIDVQQKTRHLTSLGATMISRPRFMEILEEGINEKMNTGKWH
jgi:leucyl/phenylalanyl-tRNA--protein transferase